MATQSKALSGLAISLEIAILTIKGCDGEE
jgi:hypothetical protein